MEEGKDLNKFFQKSEVAVVMRSEIHPSDYNPRVMDEEARRNLRRSIRNYGVVGGIVVNRQTGMTIVGGHQKVQILDDINKYDADDPSTDYALRVELVDVDPKTEKEMNIALNNSALAGRWDFDRLAALIPDIDYKDVGFTEADLSMIGVDYSFQTSGEADIADAFSDLTREADEAHEREMQARKEQRDKERAEQKAEREAIEAAQREAESSMDDDMEGTEDDELGLTGGDEPDEAAKTHHVKDIKSQVWEQATSKAMDMQAYVMLSFDNWENKAAFMRSAGYAADAKFIKGEDFEQRVEFIMPED